MATRKHSTHDKQNARRSSAPAPLVKVDSRYERHGQAAAIALWVTLDDLNPPLTYGDNEPSEQTRRTLTAYLDGYSRAAPLARDGFVTTIGEFMSTLFCAGEPNAEAWAKPEHMRGPKLTKPERDAHVRAWLKGGVA